MDASTWRRMGRPGALHVVQFAATPRAGDTPVGGGADDPDSNRRPGRLDVDASRLRRRSVHRRGDPARHRPLRRAFAHPHDRGDDPICMGPSRRRSRNRRSLHNRPDLRSAGGARHHSGPSRSSEVRSSRTSLLRDGGRQRTLAGGRCGNPTSREAHRRRCFGLIRKRPWWATATSWIHSSREMFGAVCHGPSFCR